MSTLKHGTRAVLTAAVLAFSVGGTLAEAHTQPKKHAHAKVQHRKAVAKHAQAVKRANAAKAQASRRLAAAQQRALIQQQQAQVAAYRRALDAQRNAADAMARTLEQQRRIQQAQYVQQYNERLWQQQEKFRASDYDYDSDPYFQSPPSYAYVIDGRSYQTNEYGAKMLREAVNTGYEEGLRAGRADAMDDTPPDYRNSYAYQEPYYGYNGYYLDQQQYAYAFRQGFQRGYDDGYYERAQYRSSDSGTEILDSLVDSILNMRSY